MSDQTKTCQLASCGATFTRGVNEGGTRWRGRKFCSARCGALSRVIPGWNDPAAGEDLDTAEDIAS